MLILATGHREGTPYACVLPFNGAVGNIEEAILLLTRRRGLFRDWIETVSLVHEERVIRHWRT